MRQQVTFSKFLLLTLLAASLVVLNSCNTYNEIHMGGTFPQGDADPVSSDGDADPGDTDRDVSDDDADPIVDERYDDREMTNVTSQLSGGKKVHANLVPENFQMAAMLRQVRWVDNAEQDLQVHSGVVLINSILERTDVIFKQTPRNFRKLDIWLDRLFIGIGDGQSISLPENLFLDDGEGLNVSWQEMGGGDGRGIILPHLIVDRVGNEVWEDVEIKMSLDTLELPDEAKAREQWVRELVENLEVIQKGKVLGRGNVAATMSYNHRYFATDTGQSKCYNEEGLRITCVGSGQDGEDYDRDIHQFESVDDGVVDTWNGLTWHRIDASVLGGHPYSLDGYSFEETVDLCETKGWRIPTLIEYFSIEHRPGGVPYEVNDSCWLDGIDEGDPPINFQPRREYESEVGEVDGDDCSVQ